MGERPAQPTPFDQAVAFVEQHAAADLDDFGEAVITATVKSLVARALVRSDISSWHRMNGLAQGASNVAETTNISMEQSTTAYAIAHIAFGSSLEAKSPDLDTLRTTKLPSDDDTALLQHLGRFLHHGRTTQAQRLAATIGRQGNSDSSGIFSSVGSALSITVRGKLDEALVTTESGYATVHGDRLDRLLAGIDSQLDVAESTTISIELSELGDQDREKLTGEAGMETIDTATTTQNLLAMRSNFHTIRGETTPPSDGRYTAHNTSRMHGQVRLSRTTIVDSVTELGRKYVVVYPAEGHALNVFMLVYGSGTYAHIRIDHYTRERSRAATEIIKHSDHLAADVALFRGETTGEELPDRVAALRETDIDPLGLINFAEIATDAPAVRAFEQQMGGSLLFPSLDDLLAVEAAIANPPH